MRGLIVSIMSVVPFAAGAEAAADLAAAERLETAFDGLAGFRAEFRQSVTDARGQVIENAEGTVSLARPGRFRWDYRVPEQVIVSDGVTVWFHDVGLEQVTIRSASDTLAGTPALLLSGRGDLGAEFEISDGGAEEGLAWSRLMPRSGEGDFRELRVGITGGELRRMMLLDRLGQVTRIDFDRVERNPRFDDSTFNFNAPPGVDVVGRSPAPAP